MSSLLSHVRMPVGVPACPLTKDRVKVEDLFKQGYNVITFKTVRSRYHSGNPKPHVAYIPDPSRPTIASPSATSDTMSLVNSMGMPSSVPGTWKAEVRSIRFRADQQLIVSVVGSGPQQVSDFVEVARMAAEVCEYVELNISCPNEMRDAYPERTIALIYQDTTLVNFLVQSVRLALPDIKLLVKVGYIPRAEVPIFLDALEGHVDGITAINTVPMEMFKADAVTPYFPGRPTAGISGALIKNQARETVAALMCYKRPEIGLIATGGISAPEDVGYYLKGIGVEAVQMATAVMIQKGISTELLYSETGDLSKDG